MPRTNGSGDDFNEDTPVEVPHAVLDIHRPYVLTLSNLCSEVNRTNHILSDLRHDICQAIEPISEGAFSRVGKALGDLADRFRDASTVFGK